jgi:dipeptidase
MPSYTASGHMIFGKNSDREPNEAQAIIRVPAISHDDQTLSCTYIKIPQMQETYEVLLSKPYQMWGAEMGMNQFGLTIGNEAVFTKIKFKKDNQGLTGMDMLRLALERCKDADSALELITSLLEQYGQDACGGYRNTDFFYHNSFLIADPARAWVLETAGKHWAAVKVKGFRAISNRLTIGEEFDLYSKGLHEFARQKGYIKKGKPFHFANAFNDTLYTRLSNSKKRLETLEQQAGKFPGQFSVSHAMDMLSTCNKNPDKFTPARADTSSVCMVATGKLNPSQTTGSMVAEIRQGAPSTCWLTGTSIPCISVFKPFFMPGQNLLEGIFPEPSASLDESFWWQTEALHRQILYRYRASRKLFEAERAMLQQDLIQKEAALFKQGKPSAETCQQLSNDSFTRHKKKILEWKYAMKKSKPRKNFAPFYNRYLKKLSTRVGIDL